MRRLSENTLLSALLVAATLHFAGCGTTRSTDTNRSATEQLLISDAIDRAVQTVNVQTLGGQTVFLDDSRLGEVVDRNYLISTLRQHLLASGCLLRDQKDQADFIVEARAGAVGTDRNDLLFGVPSMNVPQIFPLQPVPGAAIPEIPFAKRRDQRGIAKIAVFAYHRETGTPVWQSGVAHQESSSNDVWILGAGPFQRGTIYEGTAFAGKTIGNEEKDQPVASRLPPVELQRQSVFTPPSRLVKQPPPVATEVAKDQVVQAAHSEAAAPPAAPAVASAPAAATAPPTAVAAVPTAPVEPAPAPAPASATPIAAANPAASSAIPAVAQTPTSPPQTPLPQPRFNSPF